MTRTLLLVLASLVAMSSGASALNVHAEATFTSEHASCSTDGDASTCDSDLYDFDGPANQGSGVSCTVYNSGVQCSQSSTRTPAP